MDEFHLDLLDRRIINTLNEHCRMPYSEIAKRTKTSKEVVNYRVNRLLKQGIIREFVTIFGFGHWGHKVLVEFSTIDVETERSVIAYLRGHPNINWLTSCSGNWDIVFTIMAKDPKHLDTILREILARIGQHIHDYRIATSIGSDTFGHTFILGTVKEIRHKERSAAPAEFDDKDRRIARLLVSDARTKLTDITAKTGIPFDTVKYRIKRMESGGIIKRYRLILDTAKLGYHRYEIFIRCVNLPDLAISKFREYGKQNPNIEYFSRCVGSWDIEYTAHFKTSEELRACIIDIKTRFGDHIQKFETIMLFETYNFVYLPEELR